MEKLNVAKILLKNTEGRFLVVRKNNDYDATGGKWELPGGKIKENETRTDAAERELYEETGIKSSEFEEIVRVETEELKSDKPAVNCWITFSETESPDVELDKNELSHYRWVTPEEFRTMDWHSDAGYGLPAMVYLDKQ